MKEPAADREIFTQVLHPQQYFVAFHAYSDRVERNPPDLDWSAFTYNRTSIASLSPSLSKLNDIEVIKIMTPGRAATRGFM
jgi:hypothetical protein